MFIKSVVAVVAVLAAFATVVSAQTPPVTITQPLNAFNWTAGQTYVIAWTNPVVPQIPQIWLAQGTSTALNKIELIAQNVDTSSGSYSWTISPNLTTGQYSLELGIAPNIAYAGPFTITSPTGLTGSPTAAAPGSSAPASSAAASSAAASSAASSSAASPSASSSAAASPAGSSSSTAAAPTSTSKSGANMVAPMAAVALVPAILALF